MFAPHRDSIGQSGVASRADSEAQSIRIQRPSLAGPSALLLLRTPFQAWVAAQVLHAENISSYDLLYFTQNDGEEDRFYFEKLAHGAERSQYCYAPVRRFDIFGHLDFRRQTTAWHRNMQRDLTLMASVNSPVLNAISSRQESAELVTFDDGLANILPDSMYLTDRLNLRGRAYRWLLGALSLDETKTRIARHYTLYPKFRNIVGNDRIIPLTLSKPESRTRRGGAMRTFFLGQPFEEAFTADQIALLEEYFRGQQIDWYVRHPRERKVLNIGVPLLNKDGRIAEEAILENARGYQVRLIGSFSSVFFNLGPIAHRRTMVLFRDDPLSKNVAELAEDAGCETVFL